MGMQCAHVTRAVTKEEVIEQMYKHAASAHEDQMKEMEKLSLEGMRRMMMEKILEE
jgi:predicted small metal-binding protein